MSFLLLALYLSAGAMSADDSPDIGGHGTGIIFQPGDGTRVALKPHDCNVHHNHVTCKGRSGNTGMACDQDESSQYWDTINSFWYAAGNTFHDNRYHIPTDRGGYLSYRYKTGGGIQWHHDLASFQTNCSQGKNSTEDSNISQTYSWTECDSELAAVAAKGEAGTKEFTYIDKNRAMTLRVNSSVHAAFDCARRRLTISLSNPSQRVSVAVHTLSGRRAGISVRKTGGGAELVFDPVKPGVYIVRIESGGEKVSKRVMIAR
jgi:hypothetical protein